MLVGKEFPVCGLLAFTAKGSNIAVMVMGTYNTNYRCSFKTWGIISGPP